MSRKIESPSLGMLFLMGRFLRYLIIRVEPPSPAPRHNSGSDGRKVKHLRVQAYFLQPNLAKSRVTGEQFVGSVKIPLVPSARAQSKQKVGHRGEKRDSVSLLICRVFKTTGP